MTDNRYCNLHTSADAVRMLEFRFEDEETGFGVMPGWDEVIEIPPEFEPPRLENDEILPTKIHPSWPLGRPQYLSHPPTASFGQISLSKARGRSAPEVQRLLGRLGLAPNALRNTQTIWSDWGLKGNGDGQNGIFVGIVEDPARNEVAPGMAGARRSPTPPSPQIRRRKRSRTPTPPSSPSNTSAYPDSPPPQSHRRRRVDREPDGSHGSRASTPGAEGSDVGSGSAMTEPLNDPDQAGDAGVTTRVARRWTRRRRNTGTRGNPLEWLGAASEGAHEEPGESDSETERV